MPDFFRRIQELETRFSIRVEFLKEATSTNDLAGSGKKENGDVVWAENQTRGRGQRGNSWHSTAGENLTFSVVLKPRRLAAENQFYISKIVSLALISALSRFKVQAKIKWPNDIYIGEQKVAGILIENDLQGAFITKSIAGIGLNVNQTEFSEGLPNPVSLHRQTGEKYDRITLLEVILEEILKGFSGLENEAWNEIDTAYMDHLFRRDGVHLFANPSGELFEAGIETVRPSGELILRRRDGATQGYLFKEVEFVIKKSED